MKRELRRRRCQTGETVQEFPVGWAKRSVPIFGDHRYAELSVYRRRAIV